MLDIAISELSKIAVFLPSLSEGGVERVMLNLAEGFAHKGIPTDMVLAQATGSFLSQASNVRIVDLKSPRLRASLFSLIRYIKAEKPDYLICSQDHANVIALLAKFMSGINTKVIITLHSYYLSKSMEYYGSLTTRLVCKLSRVLFPKADGIVAVSEGVAKDYARELSISLERIKVIYNPVLSNSLFEKARQKPQDWGEKKQPVLIAVGRLALEKDFTTLIKAFQYVNREVPAKLIILGEGEQRSQLQALIEQLGLAQCVSLIGFQSNPYSYMSNADVFVLSSMWEGLPTVLIEALALGLRVVTTDCGGAREIMDKGFAGFIVPVGNELALSKAIHKALTSPAQHYFPHQLTIFSAEVAAQNYLDYCRNLG